MATTARKTVATAVSADDLAELDRVCERQDLSRAESIERGEAEFARGECRALDDVQRELGLPTC